MGELGIAAVVLIVLAALYFAPSVVAVLRRHHNALAIFAVNLLLGWTFLGWVAALVWALTVVHDPKEAKRGDDISL